MCLIAYLSISTLLIYNLCLELHFILYLDSLKCTFSLFFYLDLIHSVILMYWLLIERLLRLNLHGLLLLTLELHGHLRIERTIDI
jgi:hypothetical protein